MYFSYCIMYRDEENQRTEHNWTTVGLSDDMKYLINSSGVTSPLTASFMKYKHVFHNLPMTNNELNRCLVGADTSCEIETTTMPNEIMKRPVLKGGKTQLKKCPCCGHDAITGDDTPDDCHRDGPYFIYCEGCGLSTDTMPTIEDAIKVWNKRITDA